MVYIAKQIFTYGPKEVRTGSGEREVDSKENIDNKKDKEKCLPLSNLFKMGCLQIESTGGEQVTEAGDRRKEVFLLLLQFQSMCAKQNIAFNFLSFRGFFNNSNEHVKRFLVISKQQPLDLFAAGNEEVPLSVQDYPH